MEEQDLIKKLEEVKAPEIELAGHKRKLRAYLLSQYSKREVFSFFRKALPMGFAFIILLALVFETSIFQRPDIVTAKDIAMKDPRFKALIEEGGVIKETQLADSKAYILVSMAKPSEKPEEAILEIRQDKAMAGKEESVGEFLIEIDFKKKEVSQIKELPLPDLFLSERDKEKITLISEESEAIKKAIPGEAAIEEIKPSSSQTKLVKKGNKMEAEPNIKATVIYKADGKKWQAMINFDENRVESIEFLGEQEK